MFISKVFSLFFVCLLAACGNSVLQNENTNQNQQKENTNQNQQKETTELSLSMKRSFCAWGGCPIYDLTIQPDGKVIFEDKKYTKTIGKTESKLEKEKIKQLITEIEKANFFSLHNTYNYDSNNCPVFMSDSPSTTLYIKLNGKEKTINHNWGCWVDIPTENDSASTKPKKNWSPRIFPQELYLLENKIDEIVETKRWIGERK